MSRSGRGRSYRSVINQSRSSPVIPSSLLGVPILCVRSFSDYPVAREYHLMSHGLIYMPQFVQTLNGQLRKSRSSSARRYQRRALYKCARARSPRQREARLTILAVFRRTATELHKIAYFLARSTM